MPVPGASHGYAIAARLEQVSGGALVLNKGTLYPGLMRLEQRGLIRAEWGTTEKNRRARFYGITPAGRSYLAAEKRDLGRMVSIRIEYVSDNYFDVLQVDAEHGRTFLAGEGRRPGDAPFVVLTHHAWQTRFGGDAAVLGKVVRLGPASMTVIGITPEPFTGVNGFVPVEAFAPPRRARSSNRAGWTC